MYIVEMKEECAYELCTDTRNIMIFRFTTLAKVVLWIDRKIDV
jgi:hypothetical protein